MKMAFKSGFMPAMVTSIIAAIGFGTPDMLVLLFLFLFSFIPSLTVLLIFLRFGPPVLKPKATGLNWKRRTTIWLIAAGMASLSCCVLRMVFTMHR
jgi:hypothetical protein